MFDSPTIKNVATYGGKLTENVVSAICRDLLAAALVQCECKGLEAVLHVHDEIVIEVPYSESEDAYAACWRSCRVRPPGLAVSLLKLKDLRLGVTSKRRQQAPEL